MSNYPNYPAVPSQGQPVPGEGHPVYSESAPPQYAPPQPQHTHAPPPPQQYGYHQPPHQHQQYQQPPQQYQQPAYEQPPPQPPRPPQQQYSYGARPSDPAAPALPPRPPTIPNRLMAQSTLNFPPPPRSPNRPPQLPPRPQQSQPPQQYAQTPQQQAYGQSNAYGPAPPQQPSHSYQHAAYTTAAPPVPTSSSYQTANPATAQDYVPRPPPLPPAVSNPVYQQGYYPPPPPGPPPLAQPVSPISTVSPVQTPPQPSSHPAAADVSPPPSYTAGTQSTPVEKQSPQEQQFAQYQPPPAPPPPPPPASTTSYAYTYGQTYSEQPAAVPVSPPTQSPPHIRVQDTGASTVSAVSTSSGSMDEMQSMVERLNLKQPAPSPAAEPFPEPRAFVAELSGESATSHVEMPEPAVKAPTPTTTYALPPPPPSQAAHPPQSPRSGPQPAYVPDAPDEEPPSAVYATAPAPASPQDTPGPHYEQAQHSAPPPAPPVQQSYAPPPPPAPLQEQYTTPNLSATPQQYVPPSQPAPPRSITPAQQQVVPPLSPTIPADQQQHVPPPQAAALSGDTSALPSFRPVTHCIDTPVSFSTWWYSHDSAPDYSICSKCYMDYIYPTTFQNHFAGRYLTDGVNRRCRFKVPRITDQLLPDAVSRGTLDSVLLFMNQRMRIPDCKGLEGATASEGVKWYKFKNNQLPGFVSCEACYQDIVCMSQFAFSFENALGQAQKDTWACDICVPFIRKEFELRTEIDDWPSFLNEAKARLGMPACPKTTSVTFGNRKWFVPVDGQGPPDAVLCVACYCDYILQSGQEKLWQQEKQDPVRATKTTNTCIMGIFHLRMALSAAEETKEWQLFWASLNRIAYREKPCIGDGIVDGNWFTLLSQPDGYNVCGACHAGIVQSLHLDPFFAARKTNGPAPGEAHVCAFNMKSQRFVSYIRLMLQTWLTADCTAWDAYASRYAAIPTCPRNTDYKNRAWFGWPECVVCADCYMEFVQGTALDTPERMTFHEPAILERPHICEMYSPRMRKLYQEACSKSPPSTTDMFAYVERRRLVYWQTIPRCRQILIEEKLLANQISMARTSSVFYNAIGGITAIGSNHHYTYGASGVGYGFENAFQLQGAQYNAQANAMSSQLGGSKTFLVGQLEQQWLAIE